MNRQERRAQEVIRRRQFQAENGFYGKALPPGPESRVRVALVIEDTTGEQHFRVKIESRVRPGRVMHIDVPVKHTLVEKQIMISAGAMSEAMNEKYKDALDPDKMARNAKLAYQDLLMRLDFSGETIGVR